MLYAAKCYWPGVTETDVERVAARAGRAGLAAGGDGRGQAKQKTRSRRGWLRARPERRRPAALPRISWSPQCFSHSSRDPRAMPGGRKVENGAVPLPGWEGRGRARPRP